MRAYFVIAVLAISGELAAAPPALWRIFPAGVQRGKTVAVSTGSSVDARSVSAWSSRDDVHIQWSADRKKLEIAAAADAAPGVCWIRLYNAQGASEIRPIIVGMHPEVVEVEPNEHLRQAQRIEGETVVVNGALSRPEDVDTFAVKLKAGQTLVASMTANQVLGSPMDGVLQVVSADGFVLAQNDDDQKFDPRIVYTAPTDGDYFVRAFSFPAEPGQAIRFYQSPDAIYWLTLSTGPFVDYPWPLAVSAGNQRTVALRGWNLGKDRKAFDFDARREPGAGAFDIFDSKLANSATCRIVSHATAIEPASGIKKLELPTSVSGIIEKPNEVDEFVFSAAKGQTIAFEVESRKLGFPLDPVIALVGPDGTVLAEADDAGSGNEDATLNHQFPSAGDYRIRVFDRFGHGGDRFVYLLTAQPAQPQVLLTVASDAYVLSASQPLTIEVNVARTNGFADELTITAIDLPPGVNVRQATSKMDGNSSKSVKLTLEASANTERSGPFRIVGIRKGDPPIANAATASLPKFQSQVSQLWLTTPLPTRSRMPAVAVRPRKKN